MPAGVRTLDCRTPESPWGPALECPENRFMSKGRDVPNEEIILAGLLQGKLWK